MDMDGVLLPKLVGAVDAEHRVGAVEAEQRGWYEQQLELLVYDSKGGGIGGQGGRGSRLLSMGHDI